jgi:hypothetical protein
LGTRHFGSGGDSTYIDNWQPGDAANRVRHNAESAGEHRGHQYSENETCVGRANCPYPYAIVHILTQPVVVDLMEKQAEIMGFRHLWRQIVGS